MDDCSFLDRVAVLLYESSQEDQKKELPYLIEKNRFYSRRKGWLIFFKLEKKTEV